MLRSQNVFRYFTTIKRNASFCSPSFRRNPHSPTIPPCCWSMLPNGLRVITEEISAPFACVSLYAEAGPRFETPCNNGITHFIEHLAYKGFITMNRCDLEANLRLMGARLTVETTREIQKYSAICPAQYVSDIISFFGRFVLECDPSDYDVECEKKVVALESAERDQNPKLTVFDYLYKTAFQGTTLAQSIIGPTRNIQRFDRAFVKTCICEQFQPFRLVLAVSAPFDHHAIVCWAQEGFGCLPPSPAHTDYGPCRFTGSQVLYRNDDLPFVHVILAVEAPPFGTQEYFEMLLLKYVLGRWDRSIGGGIKAWPAIAQASSVENLCDSYQSFYTAYRDVGIFGVYFVCDRMAVEDMFYQVQDKLMNACITLCAADYERALGAFKLDLARKVNGAQGSCNDMGVQMMYTCGRKSLLDMYYVAENLTVTNLTGVAERYIYDRCPAVAAVGPTEGIPDYTRIRAAMYWLRL